MKQKLMRALAAVSVVVGGLGVAAFTAAPAGATHTHLCNNEPSPGDFWIQIGSTAGAGVDTGTTGLRYVPVACAEVSSIFIAYGAGATITPTPTGYRIQPYFCDNTGCRAFLFPIE